MSMLPVLQLLGDAKPAEKSPHISSGLTDRHELWHGDAVLPS